ncbi:MAG: S-layer homology domain-containing protein [Oscillospiraceae bacterium]|jgi:hypothetical protein
MTKTKTTRLLTFLMALIACISMLPVSAVAADEITVYMNVSLQGELARGKDGRLMAGVPVSLKGGSPTVHDAIEALHDAYYDGGAQAGYAVTESSYGGMSMAMLWGKTEGVGSFYINGNMPWYTVDAAPLSHGDMVDVIIFRPDYSDARASFDKTSLTAAPGEGIDLTLGIETYDAEFNLSKEPLSGASIWTGTDELSDTGLVTDAQGRVSLRFSEPGTYIVTARSETAITAPVCIVNVRSLEFEDVTGHWAKDSISYVASRGYFRGTTETEFSPDGTMTRAMLVTVLWRVAGQPQAGKAAAFSDVKPNQYYTEAVAWANANGIVKGYEDGRFGVSDNITREQMAAMLMRFAAWRNGGQLDTPGLELSRFTDAGKISAYAREAMKWAYAMGLISGRTGTTLVPAGTATRAEVATIIQRFDEKVINGGPLAAVISSAAAWLYSTVSQTTTADVGGAWSVIGVKSSGFPAPKSWFDGYVANLEEALVSSNGVLHERKYTEYSRQILALTALGVDPKNVAGYDLTLPLADFDATVYQGVNGAVFALLALDSGNYVNPSDPELEVSATREMYVDYILGKQLEDGGFALSGDRGDPDMTAMALMALANYREREDVPAAIERAVQCLSAMQNSDGGFASWGVRNSQSCAQVILALSALGIDINDGRFVKSGNTVLDCLLGYRNPDGGFANTAGGESSVISTEQALMALTALAQK